MSAFWYTESRKRTIFDQNRACEVHAVSACISKQCHGRRKKLDHLPQNFVVFTDFFKR